VRDDVPEKSSKEMAHVRLPRAIGDAVMAARINTVLTENRDQLFSGSEWCIPAIRQTDAVEAALLSARRSSRVIRGLEAITKTLHNEKRGLDKAGFQTEANHPVRTSRIVVVSSDGGNRFYRSLVPVLRDHYPRVLVCRMDVDSSTLGGLLFGAGAVAKAVMIGHKDAVTRLLLSFVGE